MRKKNDERKMEVYRFVKDYINSTGVAPTTDEIGAELGMAKSTVSKYMTRLSEEGLIEKHGRYRTKTTDSIHTFSKMPIIGAIACGKPILAVEDIEGYIPIDEASLGRGEYFGLIASGSSMIDAGISDGDIVYIRRQSTAEDGEIVVALIEDKLTDGRRATLKRFYRDEKNKRFILRPENALMEDIILDELTVLGVAVKVLKNL